MHGIIVLCLCAVPDAKYADHTKSFTQKCLRRRTKLSSMLNSLDGWHTYIQATWYRNFL